ncbi:MAG: HNH endonuclease [Candidatus Delongbacteria bacterium]|nr:HNH endonuclease [Candidatus Delongbacteria bacterium]
MARYSRSFRTGRSSSGYKTYNSGSGWKFTHRTVAAKKLGGSIFKGFQVHHINGNKTDNRSSNLTVISGFIHRLIHGKT